MSEHFYKNGDNELFCQMLDVLNAESQALVLASVDLRIASLTDAAKTLLGQGVFSPLPQLLSDRTITALRLCINTHTGANLAEELDGEYYNIEVRPLNNGSLLLHFRAAGMEPASNALHQFLTERTDSALATILLATRKLSAEQPPEMVHALTSAIRTCSLRIHRTLLHAQTLTAPPGAVMADLHPYDATVLCRETVEKADALGRTGLTVLLEAPKECPAVFDRRLLSQAIYNLLANAMAASGVHTIVLRLTSASGQISISVADDGAGLPPEAISHLYGGWHSTQTAEQLLTDAASGVRWGLGLPLVRRIAGLHGGVLLMRPGTPRGTIFTLTLPGNLSPLMTFGQPPIRIEDGFDPAEVEFSTLPYTLQ